MENQKPNIGHITGGQNAVGSHCFDYSHSGRLGAVKNVCAETKNGEAGRSGDISDKLLKHGSQKNIHIKNDKKPVLITTQGTKLTYDKH